MKYSFQVSYDAQSDAAGKLRARSVLWVEADDLAGVMAKAKKTASDIGQNAKLGACIPGWQQAIP